jgi:hypothetical protein
MKELQKGVYVWDLFDEGEICAKSRVLEDLSERPDAPTVPDRVGSVGISIATSIAPWIIGAIVDAILVAAGFGAFSPEILLAFISPQGAPITASIIIVGVLFFNYVEKCNPDWVPELTYEETKEENKMGCVSGVIQDVYYDDYGAEPSTWMGDVLSMAHPFFTLVPKCADRDLLKNAIIEKTPVTLSPMITCVLRDRNVCKMAEGAFIGGAIGGTVGAIGGSLIGGSMAAGAGLICVALGPFCLLGALVIGIGVAIFSAFGGAAIGAHAARTRIVRTDAETEDEGERIKGLLLEQGDLVNVKGTLISRGGQTMFRFVSQKHSSYLGKVPPEMRPEPIQDEEGNWVTVYSHRVPDNLLIQVYKDTETGEYSFEHIDPCYSKP